jgi:hypothetical protein
MHSAAVAAAVADAESGYKNSLLNMLQEAATSAFQVLDVIAERSQGSALIEASGVSVKQLLKRCCQLGANGAKEMQNSMLRSVWEARAKKAYDA